MKKSAIISTFLIASFCQFIFAQQSFLDEFVPGAKWGMTANELAESRPAIFVERNSGARQDETAPKTEQLDGNPMVSAIYRFGWPDTLGLVAVDFVCLDRESALETARKFGGGDLENNNTHFWQMEDGSSVTMMVSAEKINLRWYPLRGRKRK